MAFLELSDISMQYAGEAKPCVDGLDLEMERGEILVLLGASGCGKTTILKIIAGLERQMSGSVTIDGERMDALAPDKRPISMVFQKSLLFRHLSVEDNVNFAPRVNRSMPKSELKRKTEGMLELVGLAGMGSKRATELSGGQEQRVSLARALMVEPKVLLLDEPFSALDAALRVSMQGYIRELNRQTGVTMVFVTHDQREAVSVASRIALMQDGKLVQVGKPQDFYTHPKTRYSAEFFGWKNLFDTDSSEPAVTAMLDLLVRTGKLVGSPSPRSIVAVRPEAACNIGKGSLKGTVQRAVYQGPVTTCELRCGSLTLTLDLPSSESYVEGSELSFDLNEKSVCIIQE